ncbi:MAG: NAD(P)-dependent oxidoreductase [Acidobacteriota bacterium]|nr:NAD(P)-dependent oxidoreductase [Acidobacteriota bacterium]MDH3529095.1 NAD(P)-dependent oxidoreductase [Acidobacteriota bacterium]
MPDYKTKLSTAEIEANFAEIDPKMTEAEALFEANRCLYCYDAPCTHACPTHIDVPSFIKKIASENLRGSARVIFDANPIGASCARVCPVEVLCEGACVENTLVEKPIQIARLQRYATDHAVEGDIDLFQIPESNGKTVGIIGSGPAGLSCATYLARLGYKVTVYEKRELAGGLDTYGMAEYKMSQKDSLDEVEMIGRMGVEFRLNTSVSPTKGHEEPRREKKLSNAGERNASLSVPSTQHTVVDQIAFSDLCDAHDAVFVAVGLGKTNDLGIPGEDNEGVFESLEFIGEVKKRAWHDVPLGRTIVVIGAGNTAVDVVTQSKRLGAEKVIMVYRRTRAEMSAFDYEYELAKSDAVEFIWQASPLEIVGNGRVEALRCKKNDGSLEVFEIRCDMIVKAIGQEKMTDFFGAVEIETDQKGRVVVDASMRTSLENVFAGGDCVNGGAEAVDASQAGKRAAAGIHKSLFGENVEFTGQGSSTKCP